MIDTHLHVVPPCLPGVGSLHPVLREQPETVATALLREMQTTGVNAALAMGCWHPPESKTAEQDPLGIASTLAIAQYVPGLHPVGIADPTRTTAAHLGRVEKVLATGQVKALKSYLGYLHYAPDHPGYRPYYELAECYRLPFIFHTGDTYSPFAKLKYAQPLLVDEIAVDHRQVNFVLAHAGNPWLTDAAEVAYKNVNVYVDLSGMLVGDSTWFNAEERQEMLHDAVVAVRRTFQYAERPNRFLYGSDWPLAPMAYYHLFIAAAIPPEFHALIFEETRTSYFASDHEESIPMGMDQTVIFPGKPVPPWTAARDLLAKHGFPIQMRMIDGELAFPDEEPPKTWQELRFGTPAGMVTVRRTEDRLTFVTWGNAEPPMRQAWNALTWAFAVAGEGKVQTEVGTMSAGEFQARAELPATIQALF